MTRAWLVALLVVPAVALGQAAGTITFDDLRFDATDGYINAEECIGTQMIALDWAIAVTSVAQGTETTHTLYAANKSTTGDCPTIDGDKNDTALKAGPVGSPITDPDMTQIDVSFSTSAIATAVDKTCNETANEDIFLCVQAKDSAGNIGTARGKLTLSRSRPEAPSSITALPGERALNLDWPEVTSTDPSVEYYEVTATSVIDPENPTSSAPDPRDTAPHARKFDTPRDARLTGLTNDVSYYVQIRSFSTADNASTGFASTVGRAENVLDFWEWYSIDGREQGGCAGGPAGLASLAVAAALFALLRRRK